MRFTISVKIDNSFAFTLKSENAEVPRAKKRSPSYLRRQERRRLLKKKLVSSPAEPTNTREEDDTLNTREEDDTLEKGKYPRYPDGYYYCPIDYSTPEEESDNDKISLNLSPRHDTLAVLRCLRDPLNPTQMRPRWSQVERMIYGCWLLLNLIAGLGGKSAVNSIWKEPVVVLREIG